MPDMSGFEVISELKKSDATRKIPIIFITGLSNVENEEKGFFLGAADYITKPFHSSIVNARVKTQMQIVNQVRTIEQLCLLDGLTNIPNKRSFNNKLETEWKRAARDKMPLSLLLIDVDNFKSYNDNYGHPQGDVLLQIIAKTFMAVVKRPGDLAARWGGEEFAVLLPETDLNGALKVAETIRAAVESTLIPFAGGTVTTSVTVSVGVVSTVSHFSNSLEEFIREADKALYRAKETGKNKVCYQ